MFMSVWYVGPVVAVTIVGLIPVAYISGATIGSTLFPLIWSPLQPVVMNDDMLALRSAGSSEPGLVEWLVSDGVAARCALAEPIDDEPEWARGNGTGSWLY
jgi:hypothetical protein